MKNKVLFFVYILSFELGSGMIFFIHLLSIILFYLCLKIGLKCHFGMEGASTLSECDAEGWRDKCRALKGKKVLKFDFYMITMTFYV